MKDKKVIKRVSIEKEFASKNPKTTSTLSKHQLIYSIAGLTVGVICIIVGMALFLTGIVGSTSWTAQFLKAESTINDAAPGTVLFIVGLFIVLITRYVFNISK